MENLPEMLARIDERTKSIHDTLARLTVDIKETRDELNKKINQLENDTVSRLNALEKKIEDTYVSNEKFEPVKNVVYGAVALILTVVISALLGIIIVS